MNNTVQGLRLRTLYVGGSGLQSCYTEYLGSWFQDASNERTAFIQDYRTPQAYNRKVASSFETSLNQEP
jgi:hypothetical protein